MNTSKVLLAVSAVLLVILCCSATGCISQELNGTTLTQINDTQLESVNDSESQPLYPPITINPIPNEITLGKNLTISGTTSDYKNGDQVIVELSTGYFMYDKYKNEYRKSEYKNISYVDDNGNWSVTFDTTEVWPDYYHIYISIWPYYRKQISSISVIPQVYINQTPPTKVIKGQSFTISGTTLPEYKNYVVVAEALTSSFIYPLNDENPDITFLTTKTRVEDTGAWSLVINTTKLLPATYCLYIALEPFRNCGIFLSTVEILRNES